MFMQKMLLTISLLFVGCLIYSGDMLKINGEFSKAEKGVPAQWIINKNLPGDIKVVQEDSANVVKLTSTTKRIHIYSKVRVSAIAGEKVKVSAKIKGNGKAMLGIYLYAKNGAWIGTNLYHKIAVEPEWKEEQFVFELINFKDKKLGSVRIVFGVEKNSSISITKLQAEKLAMSAGITVKKKITKPVKKYTPPAVTVSSANVPLNFTLPKTFYGVPGVESAIYLDNIIVTQTPDKYKLAVKPAIGKITSNRWMIIPDKGQLGKHQLDIKITEKGQSKAIAQGTISLNIAPANAGEGKKLKLLVIGDSLTAATHYVREVARLLSKPGNPEWSMLGTQKKGRGVAHEGYGGWTWKAFSSKFVKNSVHYTKKGSSPFIFAGPNGKPKLDVERYFKEKCNGIKPDVITLLLGINDCFGLARKLKDPAAVNAGIDRVFTNAEILLNALREAAPQAIIGVCLTTPPNIREKAFFANYKGRYSRWGWKQVQHILVERQLKYFGNRQQDNIYIIPTELNIDSVDGYPDNNGVHPNKIGYNQIGSTIYCWLKWQLYTNKALK
ncbi:MAG: SGNH/GDSL hydrolase family protein [Victivallaceae bacterium]|nr:SGNH/GDSL hydrolase family protein [Victivallaceae bacterium]